MFGLRKKLNAAEIKWWPGSEAGKLYMHVDSAIDYVDFELLQLSPDRATFAVLLESAEIQNWNCPKSQSSTHTPLWNNRALAGRIRAYVRVTCKHLTR